MRRGAPDRELRALAGCAAVLSRPYSNRSENYVTGSTTPSHTPSFFLPMTKVSSVASLAATNFPSSDQMALLPADAQPPVKPL